MHANLPIPFWKMNGAGNDFIVIDHRKPLIPVERMAEFARLVCRRKFSVGADGLFLLEPSQHADFRWRFFNADGSEAEMCGNGARCVARFAYMNGLAAARMRFETLARHHRRQRGRHPGDHPHARASYPSVGFGDRDGRPADDRA